MAVRIQFFAVIFKSVSRLNLSKLCASVRHYFLILLFWFSQ